MMKKYVGAFIAGMWCVSITATEIPKSLNNPINSIRKIEVHEGRFSSQLMLYFSRPIFCKRKVDTAKQTLKIGFPGMLLAQFKQDKMLNALSKLKEKGLLKEFSLQERTSPVPQVNLVMTFAPQKKTGSQNNHIIVKWTKLEHPFRLTLDLFTQEQLETLKKRDHVILYATNDLVKTSATHIPKNKKLRIIIDPGHGGKEPGSISFGLKEKDISLDIAQKLKTILAEDGYQTFLTRSKDQTLSLLDRSSLSEQMNADLFISIHANSTANKSSSASGLETYHLREDVFSPQSNGGFISLSTSTEQAEGKLKELLEKNYSYSAHLAQEIQRKTLEEIRSHHYPCNDRGVKQNDFHILLRNIIPSALVEVGFISDKEEAARLKASEYRTLLAKGIYKGITSYIKTHY